MNTRHHYLSLLRTFALATLTAAAVTACTDDNGDPAGNEPLTPPDGNGGIPVTFTANINPGSDADPAAPDTRTVLKPDGRNGFTVEWKGTDNNPTSGYDRIYIWAVKGTDKIGFKTYVPATSDASSELEPKDDGNKLTLTETGEWKFTAVYGPYSIFNYEPLIILSHLEQSAPGKTDHIAGNDFSVATATQTVDAGDMPNIINFKFEHKLSALQLRITNQTGEELTVKEIRLSAAGGQITSYRAYDVATGKWKTDEEQKADYLKLTASNFPALPSDGTAQNLHMLLFPEPAHGGTDMIITVITDRGEYTLTKPAPSGGFLAGKNYLTDITIKSSGLQAGKETWRETIRTAEELKAFRNRVNGGNNYSGKTIYLADNITLTGRWTPIGTSQPFRGTFDGDGYSISGLDVNNGTVDYAGLFGYVLEGTVRNLRVSGNVTTTTGLYAGGIVGYLYNKSTVENCIFNGNINGSTFAGGIAGSSQSSSQIRGCHTKGSVKAPNDIAGGIVGYNYTSSIDDCYSEAEVTAPFKAGGIVGENLGGRGAITNCYATGEISGKMYVGGIVGSNKATIENCIALNPRLTRTSDTKTSFGRIVGNNQGTLNSCAAFADMTLPDGVTATSAADGIHGIVLTAANCLAKTTYTSRGFAEPTATTPGWAFDSKTTWTYLPWNPAFEKFSGISEANYKISASHLTGGGTN